MGVVSVALDTELDRSIALKEIRDGAADDAGYRARFLAEAEITGKLEHPGIIPIYGLGTYADGRPFYAMRLIRGEKTGSLMTPIERFHKEPDPAGRVVEFRGLLRRFLDVCNAAGLRPQQGRAAPRPQARQHPARPVRRDPGRGLGPGQGRRGWPSRTPTGEDDRSGSGSRAARSPRRSRHGLGTPEYAPPEQMTGDLPNIGPRSDVYGLGAILYCLMTGRPRSRARGSTWAS